MNIEHRYDEGVKEVLSDLVEKMVLEEKKNPLLANLHDGVGGC